MELLFAKAYILKFCKNYIDMQGLRKETRTAKTVMLF